jgi:hypothetical protein
MDWHAADEMVMPLGYGGKLFLDVITNDLLILSSWVIASIMRSQLDAVFNIHNR